MPRNRKRTTDRGQFTQETMEAAAIEVAEGKSIRSVARERGICHVTLFRFCAKARNNDYPTVGYKPHNKVFNSNQEEKLATYVKRAADLFYGLSTRDLRRLAFQCASYYNLIFPATWSENGMAGVDWLNAFLKRHPSLSIRRAEATSLGRAINFNKNSVSMFFNNLSNILDEQKLEPHNVYNVDETGVHTVQIPNKVIAEKGRKQVGAITSSERGALVTVCVAVNAVGNCVPPMFLFPRKNFRDHFLRGGPAGCTGAANGSGWMQGEQFLQFIKHFANHAKPSRENKILLLLDNHESHLYLPTIEFCREHGIILLSFPPHCSHKLQPLDVTVFGPFKRYINSAMDSWMRSHPGLRLTIYNIPEVVSIALPLAMTPKNIIAGFHATGIWPFNRNIFDDSDFIPCGVTNKPPRITKDGYLRASESPQPSTSTDLWDHDVSNFSPEMVRPVPKATPNTNKQKQGGRRKGKSAILTSSPEKNAMEVIAKKRKAILTKKNSRPKAQKTCK